MDRKAQSEKSKGKSRKGTILAFGGVAAIALAVGMGSSLRSHAKTAHGGAHGHAEAHGESQEHGHAAAGREGILDTYISAFRGIQAKIDAIQQIETENERLKLENAHLRLQLEGVQFSCQADSASSKTKANEHKLDRQTGSTMGRDLASIAYRAPTQLPPSQLYTLGVSYFKAREDEKAAVIFTFLTGLDRNDAFKTAKNYLMTGVAWYRLENFAVADRYFDRVLKTPVKEENLRFQAQARLWKAIVAQTLGKHAKSQFWLTDLVDHHPHSAEAGWVNSPTGRTEAHRGVASED